MKNEEDCLVEQKFYQAVADLLQIQYDYSPFPYMKATRWNNRIAGNGRFPGCGLVRRFSDNVIIISLHTPKVCVTVNSEKSALAAIKQALGV